MNLCLQIKSNKLLNNNLLKNNWELHSCDRHIKILGALQLEYTKNAHDSHRKIKNIYYSEPMVNIIVIVEYIRYFISSKFEKLGKITC